MKGVPFSNKRYTKWVHFLKKWLGLDLGAEPPRINFFEYPPGGHFLTVVSTYLPAFKVVVL